MRELVAMVTTFDVFCLVFCTLLPFGLIEVESIWFSKRLARVFFDNRRSL